MRDTIRRICVCLFAVSFAFSGVTWAACIDLPAVQAAGELAVTAHDHHAAAVDHDRHSHADHAQVATDDPGPIADHDHAHAIKCCSAVQSINLTADLSATSVIFSGKLISFRVAQRDLIGFVPPLDPGIPISIA